MTDTRVGVTLGVQMGGDDADLATNGYVSELRDLLRTYCGKVYSQEVLEFAIVLRVDGSVSAFEFEGCQKLRRSKKEKYITVDVGVPVWRWRGKSAIEIKHYLYQGILASIEMCLGRLKRDKVNVNGEELLFDLSKIEAEFFATVRSM